MIVYAPGLQKICAIPGSIDGEAIRGFDHLLPDDVFSLAVFRKHDSVGNSIR